MKPHLPEKPYFTSFVLSTVAAVALLFGPAAWAQTQVEFIMYGLRDEGDEKLLVNGDSLIVDAADFYEIGQNADSESGTMRCAQHTLRRNGADVAAHAICTKFYLDGGTHQSVARLQGDHFVWETVSGTGKYENLRCEGISRPGVWNAHRSSKGPIRWTNHSTGTCTTVNE